MIEVRQTLIFREWLDDLKDQRAAARIAKRLLQLQDGLSATCRLLVKGYRNFGSIMDLAIDCFVQHGAVLIVLLCGGGKGSQKRDIIRAKASAKDLEA